VQITGVEPVVALREIAYAKGVLPTELFDGDATALAFADGAFDVVCAFGVLHHIQDHSRAISEMFRMARKAVFISAVNIYGQGSYMNRLVKRCCHALHIWPVVFFLKTRGRNYI
jgi:ubiquinone/menaquinone biosynthesis C-methylase UbiE